MLGCIWSFSHSPGRVAVRYFLHEDGPKITTGSLNPASDMIQPHSFSVWPEYFSLSGWALLCTWQPVALGMHSTSSPRPSYSPLGAIREHWRTTLQYPKSSLSLCNADVTSVRKARNSTPGTGKKRKKLDDNFQTI